MSIFPRDVFYRSQYRSNELFYPRSLTSTLSTYHPIQRKRNIEGNMATKRKLADDDESSAAQGASSCPSEECNSIIRSYLTLGETLGFAPISNGVHLVVNVLGFLCSEDAAILSRARDLPIIQKSRRSYCFRSHQKCGWALSEAYTGTVSLRAS